MDIDINEPHPVTPTGNIHILKDVPLDNSYTDTLDFVSKATQLGYFIGHTKFAGQDFTPVRMQNKIRYPKNADDLYNCNYLIFQNKNYGNKWFYAFITSIDYINPEVSEIGFELDVMQTWAFDYELGVCMIEREHTETDKVGDHCLIENNNPGQYVLEQPLEDTDLLDLCAVIQYAQDSGTVKGDGVVGGLFTGLHYMSVPLSSPGALLDLLQTLANTNNTGNIVATYTMPRYFYTTEPEVKTKNYQVPLAENQNALGSYVPKNKKCLVYPYTMLMVSNSQGQTHMYRWEYFDHSEDQGTNCVFQFSCAMGTNPEVMCVPLNYNRIAFNTDEGIAMSGYPQFAYITDTYKAWLAQNSGTIMLNRIESGAQVIGGAAMTAAGFSLGGINALTAAGTAMTANGVRETIQSHLNEAKTANEPNVSHGSQGCATMIAEKRQNFKFFNRHLREDYAKCVDDYFTMFGYLVNRLDTPNLRSRPEFNYIKTIDCSASGSIPFNDMSKIKSIFNAGVRFWHNGEIGNYNVDNSPKG